MSDHDETHTTGSGYSTPVPELDDHRGPAPEQQQPYIQPSHERTRRGTFSPQPGGQRRLEAEPSIIERPQSGVRIRDFEHAIDDDDYGVMSPISRRTRRMTVDTTAESRDSSPSPPNSVKAFAMARRPPALSFSDARPELIDLQRATSIASQRSHRSKPRTARESDAASVKSTRSAAEEDVCFPQEARNDGIALIIDYEDLEELMLSQRAARERSSSVSDVEEFPNLLQPTAGKIHVTTVDGDIIEMPTTTKEEISEPAPAMPKENPPQRFQYFSTNWDTTAHATELEGLIFPGEDIRTLFSSPTDGDEYVWWLNINCPTDEEIRGICKAFGIHPLTVEDIVTKEAREKIELFKSYYFANFRSYRVVLDEDGNREYEPFNFFVLVFREGIITFSHNLNTHASDVRKRIAQLKDYVDLSSDWICYAIIDNIVDNFFPAINDCQNAADLLDDDVYRARPDDEEHYPFLPRLGHIRKNIMGLMRLLGGKADVLRGFTKRCNENYRVTPRMEVGLYLGDIQDHVVTMMNTLGHLERMLSRAHSNYLAQLSIDGLTQSARANKVLGKVTLLASIIVPLNVVTGLFGMNVKVPWSSAETTSIAPFFGIMGSLILFIVVTLLLARRYRYL